jgi:polar amino acid transport system substrate-binding protein
MARLSDQKCWSVACTMVLAAIVSGCTQNQDTKGPTTSLAPVPAAAKVDSIAATVPAEVRQSGSLVVGVNVPNAPMDYVNESGALAGFDVDLMKAIATTMGLNPDFRQSGFDRIIPAIDGGTYNAGMAGFFETKEREKTVDFVTYFNAGSQWVKRAGADPVDPANPCGKTVSVMTTTSQDTDELPAKSTACVKAGKPPINVLEYDRQDDAFNAVTLGKADAGTADAAISAYAVKQSNGKLELTGDVFDSTTYGFPVKKGSPLAVSMQRAIDHLIETGVYKALATHWGIESGMVEKAALNSATS